MYPIIGLWILVVISHVCDGQFEIPDVTLEAYEPSGLRASIPALPNIDLFVFHGNLNKEIDTTAPGEFNGDVRVNKNTTGNFISYYNPQLKLKVGDVVHYWVYVQHDFLGYKKDNQKWKVRELRTQEANQCGVSQTKISDRTQVCKNIIVFEDNFDRSNSGDPDNNKWIVEQYIPIAPDYEFVVYKKHGTISLGESILNIKPNLITEEKELKKKTLDLSVGCTKPAQGPMCISEKFLIHNPIVSGRLVSKITFAYGEVEIKARLPSGDWIYPEIYLEGQNDQKIFIAYARGNKKLTSSSGDDIGGTLLFGGPVLSSKEPQRSEKLSSYRGTSLYSDAFHVYKLRWTPEKMELFVDDVHYGEISAQSLQSSSFVGDKPTQVHIVLGVGVGGVTDFPDDYKSGNYLKPWRNRQREQVKTFYDKKNEWYDGTWTDNSRLQVDYIRVKSI